ncbi:MAG: tyrosine-protein phosphatase [Anaeromyxobacteraceae bacterium]
MTLLEPHETSKLGRIDLAARKAGLRWRHFPIPDVHIPASVPDTGRLVSDLLRALGKGETVVIHCWGGLGRTGTIAACILVAAGSKPDEAIRHVRAARPGALEVPSQEAFVNEFAAWQGAR